ncbi:hypothetical protein K488DRAFT_82421 [Vararia minispora EC-137]|uniref:Uncharacterized protein n=1 Tax=Vararia minispora EC-137 TaxID=1314806 RepID=A0ACB8QXA5_9AGAM|nr:hypothetical protein K488DRAFT_82421 [Vararia minispora EC-137]
MKSRASVSSTSPTGNLLDLADVYRQNRLLRFVDLYTPVIRNYVPPPGSVPNSISEICISICYQTHRGRHRGAEPACRAISLRRVLPHELIFRSWIEDDFNYDLPADHPDNEGLSQHIKDPIPLPPDAYTALADHVLLPSTDIPALGPYMPVNLSPRHQPSSPLHWQEGYYFWTSRSRREIAHHLSTALRLPTDTERIYYNQRALWLSTLQEGKNPFHEPRATTNSYIWSTVEDFLPDSLDRDWPATMLIPLNDPPPLGPELVRLFEPVTDACRSAYASASAIGARQAFVARKIGMLWVEGKPFKVVRRIGDLWWDGKIKKHAVGLSATFIRVLKSMWSPPKDR